MQSLNKQYEIILCVLESVKTEEGTVASGLLAYFEKTSSLFYLHLSVLVLSISEELAKKLQMADVSIYTHWLRSSVSKTSFKN